jgi:hypothetical protein
VIGNAGLEATRECETGDQLSSREKPSSRLMRLGPPPGGLRAKSWRGGESDREEPDHAALAVVGCEPARKQGPARAGTAPRAVKALKGSSRDASGMEQGRKASGRRDLRRASRGARCVVKCSNYRPSSWSSRRQEVCLLTRTMTTSCLSVRGRAPLGARRNGGELIPAGFRCIRAQVARAPRGVGPGEA